MKKTTLVLTAASLMVMSPMAMAATTDVNTHFATTQETDALSIPYTDSKGHFAEPAIARLLQKSIIDNQGFKGNQFGAYSEIKQADFQRWLERLSGVKVLGQNDQGLTRIEAAMWLLEATGLADGNGNKEAGTYADTADLKPEQRQALRHLANLGIMVGDGNGNFRPMAKLTRGEAVVLLDRVATQVLQDTNRLPFELLDGDLTETPYTMVQENRTAAGVYSVWEGDHRYIMAAMGEKPSTGYSITIEDIYETERGIFVKVQEKSPLPGQPVGEAITTPYAVAKIKDSKKPLFLIKEQETDKLGQINHGGQIILSKQTDLDADGKADTVAVVGTEKNEDRFYTKGYLGIFNHEGKSVQSIDLSSDALNFPVQLAILDLTGDKKLDILLESDLRSNGGRGAHQLNIYEQQNAAKFVAAPVQYPTDWSSKLALDYDKAGKAWLLTSKVDTRAWTVQLKGEQWKDYDPTTWMKKPYYPTVDHLYEVDLTDSVLKTKHYLWAGSHVNGIVGVQNTFKYQDGKFVLDKFDLVNIIDGTNLVKK